MRNISLSIKDLSKIYFSDAKGKILNDHHIVPRQLKKIKVVQKAILQGFEFEGKENKIMLEKFKKLTGKGRHANHPKYNKQVSELLKNISLADALIEIRNLRDLLSIIIRSNLNTKINNLELNLALYFD